MAFKTIGKIIKNPMTKILGNTIKKPIGMFRRNQNNIKNLGFGKQVGKYLRNVHNFRNKSVKYLGGKPINIFKYTAPQTAKGGKHLFRTESKKNIYMGSAAQMSGKQFSPVIKRSFGQMNGKEVRSLINMVSKSKPYLPLVFATGGFGKLAQLNLLLEDNDLKLKDPNNIEKVDQHKQKTKLHGYEFYKSIGSPKYICAPMVNQSELAFRLLCRRYGTELCYTPMINAHDLVFVQDYKDKLFSTCPEDQPLFAQLCGDDSEIILKAAQMLQNECNAIDLNFGCPARIANQRNYGSFLLNKPQTICNIVKKLHENLDIPVTCKIRILPDDNDTQDLVKKIEDSGCSILTVHGRTKEQMKELAGRANWDIIKTIKETVKIPVFANGGIYKFKDVQDCLAYTGVDGVMSSESLLENPAQFYKNGEIQDLDRLAQEYIDLYKIWQQTTELSNQCLKNHLLQFLHFGLNQHLRYRYDLGQAKTLEDYQKVVSKITEIRKGEDLLNKFGYYERHWKTNYVGDDKCEKSMNICNSDLANLQYARNLRDEYYRKIREAKKAEEEKVEAEKKNQDAEKEEKDIISNTNDQIKIIRGF